MQEHLADAIPAQETTGVFALADAGRPEAFQTAHGIAPSGVAEAATWAALLALPPVAVNWTGGAEPTPAEAALRPPRAAGSDALDQRAGAEPTAAAHRHEADLLVGALELVQQRRDQPRAGRAERVARAPSRRR